jgi:hypothetical protein
MNILSIVTNVSKTDVLAGGVTQVVEILPSKHKAWGESPAIHEKILISWFDNQMKMFL